MKKVMCTLAVGLLITGCSKQEYTIPDVQKPLGVEITFNNQVDVLLVVDNSPSMSLYQDRLADQAGTLVTELNRLGMDYQIAAVHSDMRSGMNGGKYIGDPKFLTKDSPNLVTELQNRIRLGNSGSDLERGIESMMKTLESTYLSGEGRGFIRDQALLAIVVLSSEDDWSSNSLNSVKARLDEVKRPFSSGTKAWNLNFIGVPNLTSSCSSSTDSGYREPGLRWIELATYTNGVIEPICDSTLGQAVANVRKRIVNILSEFVLDRKPLVSTIRVTKNGVAVAQDNVNGWEYIEEGRILRLHGTAIPVDGDQILLDYSPDGGA